MGINLPKWEELSKDEQIPIVNLPLEGNYVVVGGPGTGKTILALYRASRWKMINKNQNKEVQFLVFNKPLRQYIDDALKTMELPEASVDNWHRWLFHYYRRVTGKTAPSIAEYEYDFNSIVPDLENVPEEHKFDYLILDEAQDFPPELLRILNSISKSVTIFGDSQQALENDLSKTSDFTNAFSAEKRVYYLNQNYRNTIEISEVAHLFYTGDAHDIPARPRSNGSKPRLIINNDKDSVLKQIINYSDNNPSHTVGIFLCDKKYVLSYFSIFKNLNVENVEYYLHNKGVGKDTFSFDKPGIKIMTFATMKGLEFDAVFIPELDDSFFDRNDNYLLKRMYVASTRAKKNLTYISYGSKKTKIIEILLNNSNLVNLVDTSQKIK